MMTIQQKQIEFTCSQMIKDYIGNGPVPEEICIEKFITEYLGYAITYANFAQPDKLAFTSDGKTPILVNVDGKKVRKVYPSNTIILDSYLNDSRNKTRKRFVMAHEAGHIIDAAVEGKKASGYYSDASDGHKECTVNELKDILTLDEATANHYAAALLMPDFIISNMIKNYHKGYKFNVYNGVQFAPADKRIFQKMAASLNVSCTAMFYRLKELDGLVFRPGEEYLKKLHLRGDIHE